MNKNKVFNASVKLSTAVLTATVLVVLSNSLGII